MSKLAALLGGMTLNDLAKEVLQLQGRRGDTQLAHINKREAALLKDAGGSGTINPNTGMQEFYEDAYDIGGEQYLGQSFDTSTPEPSYGAAMYDRDFDIGTVGQPTPQVGGGQTVSPLPENFDFRTASGQSVVDQPLGADIYASAPSGLRFQTFERPPYGGREGLNAFGAAVSEATGAETRTPEEIIKQATTYEPVKPGVLEDIESLIKKYPGVSKAALAAALGTPGLVAARDARREAAQTRAEMERMAAPIRQTGEQLLQAGQAGTLTAPQQQQVQALQAAQAQARVRRGATSGTAQAQDQARVAEFVQRLAQNNIDNGIRLIGAANSFNATAIQNAYRMNQDANTLTQNYFTNLMRAAGALPAPVAAFPSQSGAA